MNLTNLLRHVSLRHVRLQKVQLLMAISGICLGVAAMVSIDIVNGSVLRSFEDSIHHITGRAALQISGADPGFPEAMLDRVQNVPGVEAAVPVIETNASLAGGTARSLMILGVDVLQDHQIRDYSLRDETADIPDPLLFLARRDSILLTRTMAEREGIAMDEEIQVQTVQGIKTFKVRGLLNPEGPARVAGGDIAVMDIYAAQMAFGKEGRIDRIDVSLQRGEPFESVKERIERALPQGYSVDTPAGRSKQIEMLLARFRKSMGIISSMAVFVGMYLIYNAVSISVVQRRKEIGILRALGTTRAQVIRLFLSETLATALLGSLLGVGLGLVFAKLTVGVVARSVTEMYLKASVTEISLSWEAVAWGVGVGMLASLAAALLPAASSARITPISALRALPYSPEGFFFSRRVRAASALLVLLSAGMLAAYTASVLRSTGVLFGSALLLILGVSLFTPTFLKGFMALFHRFLSSRLGVGGRLAGMNLQKNITRNAVAVAAIFFSITLFVSSANTFNSLRESIFDWFDSIIRADILVSSGHPLASGGSPVIPMPGDMGEEIEAIPGVLSVEPFRKGYVNYDGRKILLEIFDVAFRMDYCPAMIAEGSREDMHRLLPGQDNVVVNEGFAARYGIRPGGAVVLPTPDGPVRFGVAAIVVSYTSDSGVIWMDTGTYRRHWRDSLVDTYEVRVQSPEDIPRVRGAILERLGGERQLFALSAREFKDEVKKMLDRSFLITNAVNIITLIIAGFGIIVTLLASVLERTREIGILRAIGMKRGQVSAVVIVESALIGAAGGLLGTAGGLLIGWIELEGIFRLGYGASITYHIHTAALAGALALSIGLSALAGLYPARRAARTPIVEALSYE